MSLLQEILVPLLAVNDTTLTVVEIPLGGGAKVKKGDLIMVFETSKTTYDVEAQADGFIQYLCEADRDYEVNTVVARIFSEEAEALKAPAALRPAPVVTPGLNGHRMEAAVQLDWEGETVFSYEAERLIGSAGIDKSKFKGKAFVSAADVRNLLDPAALPANPASPASLATRAAAVRPVGMQPVDPARAVLEKLSAAKRREIEYLSDVQGTGLTSTVHIFVEVRGIFTHMNRSLKYLKDSLLPVIVYESSRLLKDYPLLNAWYNGDGVALYREVNPGFAIDIDKGLKVVKVVRAGEKTIGEIERDIMDLSGSYLDDTLKLEDLVDITFTITDLSAEGVVFFRPLINKMNSAILGLSAIDNKLERCVLSLTFDHRVTEGKLAARFLKELKERLESYRSTDASAYADIACFKCYKTLKEDLGGAGLVRCVTPGGKEGYICQACFKGF